MPAPPKAKRVIARDDIIPMPEYAAVRRERRQAIAALKKQRRLEVGPFATFYLVVSVAKVTW